MSSFDVVASRTLNNSAQDHRSSIIKVFGYQNINVLMKNDYNVHGSSILKMSMKLKEVQAHPERLTKTPSPRVSLHGGRKGKALEQLAVSPSFDVDSFSLKSPPRLAHAHTVNSEILSATLDVSSVNLLQNNPRNPIIAKRNPNIERMIQDNSKFASPRHSPSSGEKRLKSTFSSFGLYRSASCSSTGGLFSLKEGSSNTGPTQNWSNNTSLEDLSLSSNNLLQLKGPNLASNSTTASAATTHSSGSTGGSSGTTTTTGSADTNDYSVGLLTTIEEVLTMLNDTSLSSANCSPRTKSGAAGVGAAAACGSPGDGSGSTGSGGSDTSSPARLCHEPTGEEMKQHQLQVYQSMREFVGQEYHRSA